MTDPRTPAPARPLGGRPAAPLSARLAVAALLLIAALLPGCSSPSSYDNTSNEAAATFTGPRYLRGTVGSYGSFINNTPRYVGGYGMVVGLNATGSNEVPAFLREWLANEMRRNNLGSAEFGTQRFTPERVMADLGSAVVAVEGMIPPGAVRGSKYDLLVTLIDQTSTSLAGGRLFWPVQLSPSGLDRRLIYTEAHGTGYGELFVNPLSDDADPDAEFQRQAVIVNGGTVMITQKVQFVLNQPSYRVSSLIADRINARFEAADTDNLATAVAKTDGLIEINVPSRFASQPDELLALIEHLYLDPTPAFIRPQAESLGKALAEAPAARHRSVSLAWKALGPNTIPVLRPYYDHEDFDVRAAALEAGAWLNDPQAVGPLSAMATDGEPVHRVRAARALVAMPRNNTARLQVRAMLNDPDPEVRIGAYEALALVRDTTVERLPVQDDAQVKFYIDRVPSDYPMVYAVQGDELSIVVFGGDIGFRKSVFAKIDDTMILQTLPVDSIRAGLAGRYENESAFVPIHRCGALVQIPSLTPVADDPNAKLPPPDWQVEVGDNAGGTMLLNIREPELQDRFGVNLLNVPGRDTPATDPRAIALVRIIESAGRDADGKPTPAVGELLRLQAPDVPMPVVLRYQPPGTPEPKLYRVAPTVATLAYTLGYLRDDNFAQLGPDLSFSQVVNALYQLHEQGQIPAPFEARLSPVAKAIASAQDDNQAEPRPEITPEELELLDARDSADPAAEPGSATPAPE